MADLTDDLKALVVIRLATFVRPAQIVKELEKEHRTKVTLQQLSAYDPATYAGQRLSTELTELFDKTRARYHAELSDLALGSAAGRARFLTAVAEASLEKGQVARAMEAVKQIAMDLGGQFGVRPGRPGGRDDEGEGAEGEADADAGAAERAARTDSLLHTLRARRDQQTAAPGAEGTDAPAPATG